MPTFFDYFSGISGEGDKSCYRQTSYALGKEQNKWFCLQRVQILRICGKDLLQDAGRSTVVCHSIN